MTGRHRYKKVDRRHKWMDEKGQRQTETQTARQTTEMEGRMDRQARHKQTGTDTDKVADDN